MMCRLLALCLASLCAQASAPSFVAGKVRVQVLSPTLLRLERQGPRGFEDRPTFHVVDRDWPGAEAQRSERDGELRVATAQWTLTLPLGPGTLDGARVADPQGHTLWTFQANLGNSAWLPSPADRPQAFAVADTPRLVPPAWGLVPAAQPAADSGWDLGNDAQDVYVFLPGGDYRTLRRDFLKLTGPTELPPLYAFGLFHSRYWAYSQEEALGRIAAYREHGFPLDVLVVDTDWRVGASVGYEENKKLFPDMPGFFKAAHEAGVKVMFNDHPEPKGATALSPRELAFRAEGLSRWLGAGLDLWWFDRNWDIDLMEPVPGLRKEVWGMRLYHDLTRNAAPGRRPLIMANVDGIDNGYASGPPDVASHRYPIQWTGDTLSDWPFLQHAVANALHEGVQGLTPYLGEDLTGHMGAPSVELYVRFFQYGTLSPTLRLHSSNSPAFLREPWAFGPEAEAIARAYTRLRYRLLPVLYAGARRNFDTGEPVLRRLDLLWPGFPEAAREDQFLLGDALLVAPVLEGAPSNPTVPKALLTAPDGRPGLEAAYATPAGPAITRLEPNLDLAMSLSNPVPGLPPGPVAVTWTGSITPDRTLQLGLVVEGEARLYVDGRLCASRVEGGPWKLVMDPAATLEKGRRYALKVEYKGAKGRCRLFLRTMDLSGPRTRQVWLPPGTWIDAWTGVPHQGPALLQVQATLAQVPMFVREGAVLPLAPGDGRNTAAPWDPLALDLFPGDGGTELYEDDGATDAYQQGACRRTTLTQSLAGKVLTVTLGASKGTYAGAKADRAWTLRIHRASPSSVLVDGRDTKAWRVLPKGEASTPFQAAGPTLDGELLEISLPSAPVDRERKVEVRF